MLGSDIYTCSSKNIIRLFFFFFFCVCVCVCERTKMVLELWKMKRDFMKTRLNKVTGYFVPSFLRTVLF
uniref:Uncharacterized protein n=1 Tax=Ixodes ricinus TaxID=34613 RepID=A0A147BV49_IXORI